MTTANERQRASTYPSTFLLAVLPDEIRPWECDHENNVCMCPHDWRIFWGNKPKAQKGRNVYVTDSP